MYFWISVKHVNINIKSTITFSELFEIITLVPEGMRKATYFTKDYKKRSQAHLTKIHFLFSYGSISCFFGSKYEFKHGEFYHICSKLTERQFIQSGFTNTKHNIELLWESRKLRWWNSVTRTKQLYKNKIKNSTLTFDFKASRIICWNCLEFWRALVTVTVQCPLKDCSCNWICQGNLKHMQYLKWKFIVCCRYCSVQWKSLFVISSATRSIAHIFHSLSVLLTWLLTNEKKNSFLYSFPKSANHFTGFTWVPTNPNNCF